MKSVMQRVYTDCMNQIALVLGSDADEARDWLETHGTDNDSAIWLPVGQLRDLLVGLSEGS